jgi:serine protease Do
LLILGYEFIHLIVERNGEEYMGYYDDDYQSPSRQKGNRGGKFLPALLGAILGGLLVLFTVPALGGAGLLPDNLYPPNEEQNGLGTDENVEQRKVDVDLTTNVTDAVDKASGLIKHLERLLKLSTFSRLIFGASSQRARDQVLFIKKKATKPMW